MNVVMAASLVVLRDGGSRPWKTSFQTTCRRTVRRDARQFSFGRVGWSMWPYLLAARHPSHTPINPHRSSPALPPGRGHFHILKMRRRAAVYSCRRCNWGQSGRQIDQQIAKKELPDDSTVRSDNTWCLLLANQSLISASAAEPLPRLNRPTSMRPAGVNATKARKIIDRFPAS